MQVIKRERIQASGGRIDFLMADFENDVRYEIEVMLGPVDESHIIRTIEYWDVERQRYPTLQHCAVIVAEEITSRFFNVIRLLNRAVPLVAIQLSAFQINNDVVLQFIRVLDTNEFNANGDGEEPGVARDKSRILGDFAPSPRFFPWLTRAVRLSQQEMANPSWATTSRTLP